MGVKLLLAGDVCGKFDALFKRVAAVNASNGPFDILICVGSFFPSDGADDAEYAGEMLPYIKGEKTAPLPTYFIGGFGHGSKQALAALEAAPGCDIHYLGPAGIVQLKGLQVVFLDGTYNAAAFRAPDETTGAGGGRRYYTAADVELLRRRVEAAEGDIDLLLSNEWPAGVCDGLPEAAKPGGLAVDGSATAAETALAARPRYHIAGGKRAFWARPPYLNSDLGAGTHATRFIGLGDVGNTGKQKWLHALGLTPAAEMAPDVLTATPPGSTACPYDGQRGGKKRAAAEDAAADGEEGLGAQSWRWQERGKRARGGMAAPSLGRADIEKDKSKTVFARNVPFRATEEDLVAFFSRAGAVEDVVRRANAEGKLNTFCHVQFADRESMERACQLNGSELMGRQVYIEPASTEEKERAPKVAKPVEGCWFCLSNPNADVELVASVGEECYVALDKGPITDQHVLVLPIEHYAATQELPASTVAEVERYLSALRSCFAASGRQLVGFERYMRLRKSGGNHCHVNAIAVSAAKAARARETFEAVAGRAGFSLVHLRPATGEAARAAVKAAVGDGEYFVAFLPDGSRLVHPIAYGERHPLNYGREVLAELAGVPARADWKECASSREEEGRRTAEFKAAFEPYDVMLEQQQQQQG